MIGDPGYRHASQEDLAIYESVVPQDHRLRKILAIIPWERFGQLLAGYYSRDWGRPSEPPVLMLKFEILRWLYNLSDPGVVERTVTDLAFRFFLQIPLRGPLPNPSSLCRFRGRLGADGFRQVFDEVVRVAREHGVVKDRLRLKDATHVLAHIEVPSALELVAQVRDKLLAAAEPFAADLVRGEQISLEMLREATRGLPPAERLLTRVTQLRDMLVWIDALSPPENAAPQPAWKTFSARRDLAHKILSEQENPQAGDRTRSVTDTDARRAKHGQWFDGYLMDLSMDPESEIITQINVLPGNGDEAADALLLVQREEAAQGNDIQTLSMDGIGFNGAVLQALESPSGPEVSVIVPPVKEKEQPLFTSAEFPEDREAGAVTCPAGQTSTHCRRDRRDHGTNYYFPQRICAACPLVSRCVARLPQKSWGRSVYKNDYETEYRRAREKATTEEYKAVRREHMKVERKLGEVMNCHGGRRPAFRGQGKILYAELMACTATNLKRMARLLCAPKAQLCLA